MNKSTKSSKAIVKTDVSKSVTDKEFRIGNLINYRIVDKMDERQEWLEVSEIDYDDLRILGIKDEMNQDYKPIPLTEEWLLKFGFEKSYFEDVPYFEKRCLTIDGCFFDVELMDGTKLKIKYVHKLQNLYFALTGSELQIGNLTEH